MTFWYAINITGNMDLNGDGYIDLVAYYYVSFDIGQIKIYFGSEDDPDTTADLTLYGEWYHGQFGRKVASGDMNADGYADFMVGAPFNIADDKPGRIYIYSGGDTLSITPVCVYGQFNPGSWLGRKMVYVSNWNNSDYGMVLAGWISTEDYSNGVLKISGSIQY
jgi:hypothetical protein